MYRCAALETLIVHISAQCHGAVSCLSPPVLAESLELRQHSKQMTPRTFEVSFDIEDIRILRCDFAFLLIPGRGAEYCDQFVCLSVCLCVSPCLSVRKHISGTAGPIFTKIVVQIPCGCGSVLLWRRCDMLCTSGFMDDVTFGRIGPYGDAWLAGLRYRGGVWCLWMPCIVFVLLIIAKFCRWLIYNRILACNVPFGGNICLSAGNSLQVENLCRNSINY